MLWLSILRVYRLGPLDVKFSVGFKAGSPRRSRPCEGYCRFKVKQSSSSEVAAAARWTRSSIHHRRCDCASGTTDVRCRLDGRLGRYVLCDAVRSGRWRSSITYPDTLLAALQRVCANLGDCKHCQKIVLGMDSEASILTAYTRPCPHRTVAVCFRTLPQCMTIPKSKKSYKVSRTAPTRTHLVTRDANPTT